MYKLHKIFIVFFIFLLGCQTPTVKDIWDFVDLEGEIPQTTSVIPLDTPGSYDSSRVVSKAQVYLRNSLRHGTSRHYDSYGLLLPTKDGEFIHQGDASGWSLMGLSSMCLLEKSYKNGTLLQPEFDLSTDIALLWGDLKSSVFLPDGRMIRHPQDLEGTSISKDHMTMFFTSLALAKYTQCTEVTATAGEVLRKFIDYGIANSWEMGAPGRTDPSTTFLASRRKLFAVSNLYNLGYTAEDLSLGTSGDTTSFNAWVADYINENKYYCRLGYPGSCLRIANAGVFGNHLTFETVVLFRIDSGLNPTPVYSLPETQTFLENLGKVGENIHQPNYLFLSGYRHFVLPGATYNDVLQHLSLWPQDLPNETTPVGDRGCTDFQYQRVGFETCDSSATEYTGIDFLLTFAWTQLGGN